MEGEEVVLRNAGGGFYHPWGRTLGLLIFVRRLVLTRGRAGAQWLVELVNNQRKQ